MLVDRDGGYDVGYNAVPCLWGFEPASLVRQFLAERSVEGLRILDLGAGEGKNAAALAARGGLVDAIECSSAAIRNGKHAFPSSNINWVQGDAAITPLPASRYDMVVSYGLVHCMGNVEGALRLMRRTQRTLKSGGDYILASFNDRSHDLSAHEGFVPLLLPHTWFCAAFRDWEVLSMTDETLYETHPHNGIPHHHSLTRIWARKPL